MAIKNKNDINVSPSADELINENDVLVAVGAVQDLSKFEGMIVKLK